MSELHVTYNSGQIFNFRLLKVTNLKEDFLLVITRMRAMPESCETSDKFSMLDS